jgi:hypothetical protein
MTDDIVSELSELQRHASALRGLIVAAQANAPRSAEGSDPTGTVWATLGADGLPASLFVQDGWQRRLSAERFGAAVVEAFAAATEKRMAAWNAALEDGGWLSTVDGVRADLDRGGPGPSVAAPPPPPANGRPGRLDDVLNEVLTAFDNVHEVAGRSAITAQGSGVSGYHKLALRLSRAGLVACEVDAAWASQQSSDAMVAAFDEALSRAKADLAAQVAADPERSLDRVLGEALGLLNDPRRLAES